MRRAVFLDRDGTLIEDRGYLADPTGVRLVEGAARALARLRGGGWLLVVVSNQSGLARGLIRPDQHERVHARFVEALAAEGASLDASYYCLHGPADGCACRKPAPGMLREAARAHDIDLTASLMVGDKASDVEAGRAAGCRTAVLGGAPALADLRAATWDDLMRRMEC